MATNLENLKTRRDAIYAELAALDSTKAGGIPDYSIDGQSVSHIRYRMSLYEELQMVNKLIQSASGPYEVEIRGVT